MITIKNLAGNNDYSLFNIEKLYHEISRKLFINPIFKPLPSNTNKICKKLNYIGITSLTFFIIIALEQQVVQ